MGSQSRLQRLGTIGLRDHGMALGVRRVRVLQPSCDGGKVRESRMCPSSLPSPPLTSPGRSIPAVSPAGTHILHELPPSRLRWLSAPGVPRWGLFMHERVTEVLTRRCHSFPTCSWPYCAFFLELFCRTLYYGLNCVHLQLLLKSSPSGPQ